MSAQSNDNKNFDRGFSIPILAVSVLLASGGMFGAFASNSSTPEPAPSPSITTVEDDEKANYSFPNQGQYTTGEGVGTFPDVTQTGEGAGITK